MPPENENEIAFGIYERVCRWVRSYGFICCECCGCSPAPWDPKTDNPWGLPPYCHGCGSRMVNVHEDALPGIGVV